MNCVLHALQAQQGGWCEGAGWAGLKFGTRFATRDNLGGGKEGDGVAGSAVKGSGATNKDGGRVEWWVS